MAASKKRSLSLNMAKMPSSNTKGAHRAMAKGQPNTPPTANQNIPIDVLIPPRQLMNAAAPIIAVYMAKLEGRKAALAWKFPGLNTVAAMKNSPTRGLSARQMAFHINVWQRAQMKASEYRTK
jgi:hypothetical protein